MRDRIENVVGDVLPELNRFLRTGVHIFQGYAPALFPLRK